MATAAAIAPAAAAGRRQARTLQGRGRELRPRQQRQRHGQGQGRPRQGQRRRCAHELSAHAPHAPQAQLAHGRRCGVRGGGAAPMATRRGGLLACAAAAFQDVDPAAAAKAPPEPTPLPVATPPLHVESRGRRAVAIGDMHGDWAQALRALALAGVVSQEDADAAVASAGAEQGTGVVMTEMPKWTGGDTLLVQVGDILDRGDDELRLLGLFASLREEAQEAGGDVFMLHGNHEAMNVMGDFRYVTLGGFRETAMYIEETQGPRPEGDPWTLTAAAEARFALFAPGGPLAMALATNPTVLQIDDTLFAHAGVLPQHVAYGLEKVNYDMAAWMSGVGKLPGQVINGDGGVYWTRVYGRASNESVCNDLSSVLEATGAKRMVVGHTPQEGGANASCDGRVWRIDVGMSRGIFSGTPQVLEIAAGGKVQVLAAKPQLDGKPSDDNW